MWYKKVEEHHNKTIQQLYLGQNRNDNPLNILSIQIDTFIGDMGHGVASDVGILKWYVDGSHKVH